MAAPPIAEERKTKAEHVQHNSLESSCEKYFLISKKIVATKNTKFEKDLEKKRGKVH